MVSPINPDPMSGVRDVDQQIGTFIDHIEHGRAPNPTKLLQIETGLQNLVKNKEIPSAVKENLQTALQKISKDDLYGAQKDVDQALEKGKQGNR